MKKKTIAYVSPKYPPFLGGSEISLSRIVQGIHRSKKFDVQVFTNLIGEKATILVGKEKVDGIVHMLGTSKRPIPVHEHDTWHQQVIKNAKTQLSSHIDTIDLIYFNKDVYLKTKEDVLWFTALGKPIIVKMIFDKSVEELKPNIKLLRPLADRGMFRIHCLTSETVKDCMKIGFKRSHCIWIPNPVLTKTFRPDAKLRAQMRKKLGIPNNATVFIFTGRLSPQKNLEGLLNLFTKFKMIKLESELIIAGDCNYPDYQSTVTKLQEGNPGVNWVGKVDNAHVRDYLCASDMFLLASKYEGLSNSLLEAMSVGLCPVVEKNISGVKDVITNKKSGILYEWGSLDVLYRTFSTLDNKKIKQLGNSARKTVIDMCEERAVVDRHIQEYKKLLPS